VAWTCPCGASNGDNRQSCRACGRPLFQHQAGQQFPYSYPPQPTFGAAARVAAGWTLGIVGVIVVILFAIGSFSGFFSALSTSGNAGYKVEVCVTFNGSTICRDGAGATRESAERVGIDLACTDFGRGMTSFVQCEQNAPRQVHWKSPSGGTGTTANSKYSVGQEFSVGYWSYRLNGAIWMPAIGSAGAPELPDAAFLVLDITVRNDDRSASTLPPFKLLDANGREYEESSKAIFLDNAFGILTSLNPDVSKRGFAVFDVPANRQYVLSVSGGIESGKSALVTFAGPENGSQNVTPPAVQ